MARKNWRRRKTEKASPAKKAGTIRGLKDGIQCNRVKMMYRGMTVTASGSIMVESTSRNTPSRPRQRIRESAYATGTHDTMIPSV